VHVYIYQAFSLWVSYERMSYAKFSIYDISIFIGEELFAYMPSVYVNSSLLSCKLDATLLLMRRLVYELPFVVSKALKKCFWTLPAEYIYFQKQKFQWSIPGFKIILKFALTSKTLKAKLANRSIYNQLFLGSQ
jgi:hypothetical protein